MLDIYSHIHCSQGCMHGRGKLSSKKGKTAYIKIFEMIYCAVLKKQAHRLDYVYGKDYPICTTMT